MATGSRKHRVVHHAIVNGQRDHLNFGLTEGRARIRSARRYADVFHPYEFTARDGTPMHVAYARYLPGSPKHGFSKFDPQLDVTYLFEVTADAAAASFGLTPAA
ncbi:hypothetical protein [Streptomyces sp. NBC_01373]|uniref:hypothetical protein n=1 Tax=Streptomyces sp. NBC_01373 TaxID=2903843 RepID=UPI00224E05ED|nr:hypothetical protein [Streptomyces sp. NBC_01373]MCX4707072.1 hypothetical protein [Streptomyces sp. NBC_01373]